MVKLPTPNPNKMLTKTPKFKLITHSMSIYETDACATYFAVCFNTLALE